MGTGDGGGRYPRGSVSDLIVFDASPLIALRQVDLLDVVAPLFERAVVPPAVASEVTRGGPLPDWIGVEPHQGAIPAVLTAQSLGAGEREALALALEYGGATLVVDERRARRIAERLALSIVGTAGLLVAAKRAGLIDAVSPVLERMRHNGFFLSDDIVRKTLTDAGK